MKNLAKRSLSLLLALTICIGLLSGLTFTVSAASVDYVYGNGYIYNWGTRGETATFLSPNAQSFYEDRNITYEDLASLSGSSTLSSVPSSELYKKLQNLMSSAHNWQTSYADTRSLYQYTDCQQSGNWNSKKISSFYSGQAIGPAWDSGSTWNREHTWPNSKGLAGNDENDIMMLRPTSVSENSERGNTAYGESSSFYDPNQESGGKYNLHGDVARIVLYVYVRWGNTQSMWGYSGVIESKEVLLKWMEEDPVDTWELGRNDSVESMTGTRNVFVDYPELAFVLLDAVIPADMQTPSGEAAKYDFDVSAVSNNDAYGTVSLDGLTITANPAEGYVVEGYTVLDGTANVTQNGKTFSVAPKSDCTIQINFAPKAPCVVRFAENGTVTTTMTAYSGDTIQLPNGTVTVDDHTFLGWSAVEVEATNKKPTYYTAGSTVEVTGDTTFYALYTYGVAGTGNVYEKVTAAPTNWEGEYVLTATASGTNYVFVADGTDPGSGAAVREFSVAELTTEGNVLKGVTDEYVIIIEKAGSNYSMRLKGTSKTLYLMTTNKNNGFSTATSTSSSQARWNLSYSSSKVVISNAAYTSRILQYNAANALFRTYTSSQTPVVLYKRSGSAVEDFYSTLAGVIECTHVNTTTVTVPATCTATGSVTVSCDACGEILSTQTIAALGHAYENGVCTGCGEADPNYFAPIKWVGTQVQANSNLDMQFALKASDFEGLTGNYIVLTRHYADGTTDVVTINQADWTVSGNFYIVAYSGIAAKEMGDVIEAVVYNAEGKAISEVRAESIETYALSMLGKITNAEQKTMFVDLLNYGAEAQKYFHHNEAHLVNSGLTEEQKGWATQSDVEVTDNRVKDETVYGTQLSLENVVLLQAAFNPVLTANDGTCETAQELADNIIRGWNLGCSLSVVSKPTVSNFNGLIGMSTDDGQYSRSEYMQFDDKTGSVTLDWNLSTDGVLNADEGAMVSKIFVEQWNFALTEADYCTFTVTEFTYTLKSGEVVSLADKPITMQTDMSGGTGYIPLAELAELQGLLVKDIKSMHCVMFFDGMNVGETTPEKIAAQETAWGNPVTTQEMIDAVVDRGFNLIRIQVSFLNHMDAEGNIDELWLDRVQEVVDYCMNAGVYCVINTSGYMWMTCNPEDWEVQKPIYTNLWKQISERFAGYDEKLIFESCNEVLYAEGMWSSPPAEAYDVMHDIHQTFVDTVRAGGGYNETRNLMLNPYAAGYDYEMNKNFTLPTDTVEGHLLAQVHCYVPQDFTFNETNLGSTNFRYEWGTAQDKWQLGETLQGIKKRFIDELGIPVVIGEFGVAKRLSESEAAEYIGFYAEVADKYDIQLILFDDGLDIAVFDRNNLTWTRPQVIDVLFAQTTTAGVSTVEATAEAATNPMDGMTAKVTYTNYRGVSITESAQVENNNGFAMVSVNSLAFADYETMVTITLYNADGTVAGTVTDSMASYAARANNTLAKALMKFCASAYNYFM